jgi:DNA-directed RNA polymerase subunit RPC12/RpoP
MAGWLGMALIFVGAAAFLANWYGAGVASLLLVVPGILLLLRWMARAFAYRCPECGELFQLTMLGQFTAINMGDERSVRCPKCGVRSWVKILRRIG